AYHSLGTIASILHLAKINKVDVLSVSFSEAQNGKSSCDHVAAQTGLKGISVYLATVKRETTEAAEKAISKTLRPKIEHISEYGHFAFNGNTVCVWKNNNIGDGILHKDLSGFKRELKIEDEGGFLASTKSAEPDEGLMKKGEDQEMFWDAYLKKKGKTDVEPDDIDEIGSEGEETHYGNLLRHLDLGRHRIRPERIHLYDYALQLFKQGLEKIQTQNNILSEVSEAMTELTTGVDYSSDQGWALKGPRKHVVLSDKTKKFAQKLFHEGDKSGRKMAPAEVERLMKDDDHIKPNERMNAQQIRSFFSTLCRARNAQIHSRRASDQEMNGEEEEEDCED
ncbi:hypothetical protein PENTCL1PPCAC_21108, partial [Pristionchus entomophagus]